MTLRVAIAATVAAALLIGCAGDATVDPPAPPADIEETAVAEHIAELTAAVRSDTTSGDAWGRLGIAYDLHRFADLAQTCYDRASELSPDAWRWPYFSGIVYRDFDNAAAVERFLRAVELNADYVPARLYLANSAFLDENLAIAEEHYGAALELEATSINARIGLAQVALAQQDLPRAVELLEQAVGLAPQEAAVHHHMAHVQALSGNDEAAAFRRRIAASAPVGMQPGEMASFYDPVREEVTMRDGVSSSWRLTHSRIHRAAGRNDEARTALDALLAANPTSILGLLDSARLHIAEGDLDSATRQIEHAVSLAPGNATVQSEHAVLLARTNQLPPAVEAYRRSLQIDPAQPEVRNNLATLLFQTGRIDEGLDLLRETSRDFPGRMDVHHNLGNALLMTGQAAEASTILRRAIEVDPTHAGVQHLLAVASSFLGRPEESVAAFAEAVRLEPDNATMRSDLALALWESGRYEESVAQYREALRRNPQDPVAVRDLAWVLAVCPRAELRDGERSLEMAAQLNQQTQFSDPRFLDALAAAQAESGDFRRAVTTLDRALAVVQETMTRMGERLGQGQKQQMSQFADALRQRRALYRRDQPYREGN